MRFRTRPPDGGPYTFVWADALTQKIREGGRTVITHALIATGVNADGHREILGLNVTSGEDGAGGLAFLRSLVARGLAGVKLVTADAHQGLTAAVAATLPGAGWQRLSVNMSSRREGPAGPPPPLGEDLGSVTFEVQRQTRPSRWWSFLDRPVGVVPRAPG